MFLKNFVFKNGYSLILAGGLIFYSRGLDNTAYDLQFRDTYFVIPFQLVFLLIAFIILVVNLGYYFLEKNKYDLNSKIKSAHTISGTIALIIGVILLRSLMNKMDLSLWFGIPEYDIFEWYGRISLTFLAFGLLTLILVGWNFTRALLKGKKTFESMSDDSILDS